MAGSRPRIILSAAASIDGKIATRTGDSGLSSAGDLERLHRLRSKVDGIMVGGRTIRRDDPSLTVRYVRGKNPTRIILSRSGDIPVLCTAVRTARETPTILACTEHVPERVRLDMEGRSVAVVVAGRDEIDLEGLLHMLYKRGMGSILLEGGGATNWEFVRRGLVDEIFITIVPRIIGGSGSASPADGPGFDSVAGSARFRLEGADVLGDEVVLHYTRNP